MEPRAYLQDRIRPVRFAASLRPRGDNGADDGTLG
jgi:hypothetical protein